MTLFDLTGPLPTPRKCCTCSGIRLRASWPRRPAFGQKLPVAYVIGISTTSPEAARKILARWSSGGGGFLNRLVGKASNDRLLRFECALAGTAVH